MPADQELLLHLVLTGVYLASVTILWWTQRRLVRTLGLVTDTATVALDVLEQMELARDPGRSVQDRLAHALESRMVWTDGPRVEPSVRRAAAQGMAAQLIDDIRRAGLELRDAEEDEEEAS